MPKRSASPDKLTIKGLSQDDQSWLKEESERLGCDPENLVRMMIRQRMMPHGPTPPDGGGERFEWRTGTQPPAASVWRDTSGREADPSLETINQADESLDALMSAGPPVLDEAPAPAARVSPAARFTPYDPIASQRSGRGMQYQRATNVTPYPRGGFDAFTETEFVGVNRDAIGSNAMGDARNNVMRDNLRHFGVRGTVNR